METKKFLKIAFASFFVWAIILYAFVDDGGFATKTQADLLFIPILSIFFAAFFTGISFVIAHEDLK